MKLITNIFVILFVSAISYGQNSAGEDSRLKDIMFNTFYTNAVKSNIVPSNFQNNEVFIQQVGNGNIINSKISAEESTVNYTQAGNYNTITIDATAKKIQQNIIQQGNANQVFDFSYAPSQEISLNLSQTGNELHFEKFGSNSISDDIKFNMTGNSRTIIMRNFK